MSNFDQFFGAGGRSVIVSSNSPNALGVELVSAGASYAASAHPAANTAYYIPFRLQESMTVYKIGIGNGTTTSGNFDIGVYNESGTRLISSGSTAQSGAIVLQVVDTTDTVLVPGRYYFAISMDNTTGTYYRFNSPTLLNAKCMGIAEQATAFPLPATATFAANTQGYIPFIAIFGRTLAA